METTLTALAAKIPDEAVAYAYLENLRWGEDQQVCPHCASIGGHWFLKPRNGVSRKTRTGAETVRRLWRCRDCKKQFSVLTGSVMHRTKVPVRTWCFVLFEMVASKNGVSAREIERKYGLAPRTAWFMTHRVREAMKLDPLASLFSGVVIADETWIGGKPKNRHRKQRWEEGYADAHRVTVFSLVNRDSGEVRSRVIPNVRRETLRAAILAQVDLPETDLHTDNHHPYIPIGWKARSHGRVNHGMSEYVRDGITTNHAEGYFSQLKRSLDGTFHHVSHEHLARYLAQFDYLYSTRKMSNGQRMTDLARKMSGRRLT